ncbi:hypothetical protein IWX63_003212 [Arthrobacter sp. CAN_A2]
MSPFTASVPPLFERLVVKYTRVASRYRFRALDPLHPVLFVDAIGR